MIKSYFKIAIRNLQRNKIYAFINIAGLALGMICALFIFLWVKDELSFDQFHGKEDQLFRLMESERWGDVETSDNMSWLLGEALKDEFPEVNKSVTLSWDITNLLTVNGKSVKQTGIYANSDLFNIFSFPIITGNPDKLSDPSSIVITETIANKLFVGGSALGKMVLMNNKKEYQVAAVMKDIPENSSLKFDFVLPAKVFENQEWIKKWGVQSFRTYVLLQKDINLEVFGNKIKDFLNVKERGDNDTELFLQPVADMYLYSNFKNGRQDGGRIEYVRLFSLIAIIILIIACINFVNLTTARSAKRAKEIGIRKVTGAAKINLIIQFLGESMLISLLGLTLSITVIHLLLPFFNEITGKRIVLSVFDFSFLKVAILLALVTGLLAGSYPAFLLSSLNTATVLKGKFKQGSAGSYLRQGLVVFQFSISILMIISMLVVYQQTNYVKSKNLGLERNGLIYVNIEGEMGKHMDALKLELLGSDGIESVTTSNQIPIDIDNSSTDAEWDSKPQNSTISFKELSTSYDFLKTTGIKLKEGRDFSRDFKTDSLGYIVNETAVKLMGMKDPIGQKFSFWNGKGTIIGVMKDFHLTSLHKPIDPLVMEFNPSSSTVLLIKTKSDNISAGISSLQAAMKKYNPAYPFEYHFLDEEFERQYKSETIAQKLANFFTLQAILIACLGLFGLATFIAEQRTKEIGVRKVLGASVLGIATLLSRDFIKLVLIALIIACPIGWYLMSKWLQDFAYHIELQWWLFGLAGVVAIVIAYITVSFQAIKAAVANPVKSLRTE